VEIGDVLPDEVVNFRFRVAPPIVEVFAVFLAPFERRPHIADRRVEPDVPVVAGRIRNFKAEIRRRTRNGPRPKLVAEELALEVIRDFRLQGAGLVDPTFEERTRFFDLDEEVFRLAQFRRRSGERAFRVDQLGRRIDGAAFATVAVLVGFPAFRARPANEAVGEEAAFDRVEELFDFAFGDETGFAEFPPNFVAETAGCGEFVLP
jgi:hypothetical protein